MIQAEIKSLPFKFVDYADNLLVALSNDIISTHQSQLPDLSNIIIWSESRLAIHALQKQLLNAEQALAVQSLLLPKITTLQDWLWAQYPPTQPIINEANKQLLLLEAIREFPSLFHTDNSWPLTKELASLFNECTLAQVPLDGGADEIHNLLTKGYASLSSGMQNISRESEIIYRLWIAYKEQIQARNWLDPVQHYCDCLAHNTHINNDQFFYVVGQHRISQIEAAFYEQLATNNSLLIYYPRLNSQDSCSTHHPHHKFIRYNSNTSNTDNARTTIFDCIFDHSDCIYERVDATKKIYSENPLDNRVSLFRTTSEELHVNAICLQTKQWLLEGHHPIGIVSNDRLLTRRIRAELENNGIRANDLGGWALSTTSAATIIEILLDAIESNFNKEPLFDLLTNPFVSDQLKDTNYIDQVHHVYADLKITRTMLRGGIDAITNYIKESVNQELVNCDELLLLLTQLQLKSKPLLTCSYEREIELKYFSKLLLNTLNELKITDCLENDAAGSVILHTLDMSINSILSSPIKLNWNECRRWLRDILENNYFVPEHIDKRVTLCGLDHLDVTQFKNTILAGVEKNRLNSKTKSRTFFNDKVRKEIQLTSSNELNAINFIRFRQLLEQNEHLLLTAESERHGEAQELSPWIKIIELFNQRIFNQSLADINLSHLLAKHKDFVKEDSKELIKTAHRPQPSITSELFPSSISATQYQTLIDCPYKYFAKYILNIQKFEAPEELNASEFGNLVHHCLNTFHFNEGKSRYRNNHFSTDTRDELINELTSISSDVFMRTRFPDAIKNGWLQRWITNIPSYIDWLIDNGEEWEPRYGEYKLRTNLTNNVCLYGKIDQININDGNLAIIDFKTGNVPSKISTELGEAVQLPFYALLSDDIKQAEYLELGKQNNVTSKSKLAGQQLLELKNEHRTRLERLLDELTHNSPLPAYGDQQVCKFCDYEGYCRKSHWIPTE